MVQAREGRYDVPVEVVNVFERRLRVIDAGIETEIDRLGADPVPARRWLVVGMQRRLRLHFRLPRLLHHHRHRPFPEPLLCHPERKCIEDHSENGSTEQKTMKSEV